MASAIEGQEAPAQAQKLELQAVLAALERPSLETIRCLRRVLPGVGIITAAPLGDYACRQAALAAGADDVVRKADVVTALLRAGRSR